MNDIERARARRRVRETVAALVADDPDDWWSLHYLFARIRVAALESHRSKLGELVIDRLVPRPPATRARNPSVWVTVPRIDVVEVKAGFDARAAQR